MSDRKPHILLTNDDGIHAPGLRHLWEALRHDFHVSVVAPTYEQSSVSLSITTRTPLMVDQWEWEDHTKVWSVSGTPADSVKIARHVLLSDPVDLICSGINRGSNAGRNVLYSGTVAGAIEGVMKDVPSIAFSHTDYPKPDYSVTHDLVRKIVRHQLENPLPKGTLLNVNFPKTEQGPCKGVKMTRQGMQYWAENPHEREHPSEGHAYYWLGAQVQCFDEHPDSDVHWLEQGYATAVPLQLHELTDHRHLDTQRASFEAKLN